ncbi:hypothetical protein [Phyllobacterium zundukense]|nr:hypothetical protein [Phyllobacterium zundukense]ATU90537.1 hypothetical protein BLM14_01840 [Phyllobacterium zundukense]
MTLRFALSKLLTIVLRLWGVDAGKRLAKRDGILIDFANAAARRSYARAARAEAAVSRSPKAPE